jgi:hypothetical protein
MGKPKGRFREGKYITGGVNVHVKAKQVYKGPQKGPCLHVTIRFTKTSVEKYLLPQVQRFLDEIKRQAATKKSAAPK